MNGKNKMRVKRREEEAGEGNTVYKIQEESRLKTLVFPGLTYNINNNILLTSGPPAASPA